MQYSTVQCEHLLDLGWQLPEASYDLRPALLQRDAVLAHHEAEHGQGQDLGRVRLRGDLVTVKHTNLEDTYVSSFQQQKIAPDLSAGDPNLWPCVDVDTAVGLPADGGAHGVGYPHHQRALVTAVNRLA